MSGNTESMKTMTSYYNYNNNDHKVIKYYKMAIRENDLESMYHLLQYYAENNMICDMMNYDEMYINRSIADNNFIVELAIVSQIAAIYKKIRII